MASLKSITEIWQQALELNIHYFGAINRLSIDYWKDLLTTISNVQGSPLSSRTQSPGEKRARREQEGISIKSARQEQPVARSAQSAGIMVLEGEAGYQALGVFLVANHLAEEVSTRVHAATLEDQNGRPVELKFTFEPEIIVLAPSEQLLVRVMTVISDSLEPGVRYRGEFTIPELPGTHIPIVVRRRPDKDQNTVEANAVPSNIPENIQPSVVARVVKPKRPTKQNRPHGKKKN